MKKYITLFFLLLISCLVTAQTNEEKAASKAQEAMKLEDDGKMDAAIVLLQEAQRLDPGNINYPYELAYAYYDKQDFKRASKLLEDNLNHKDVNDRIYQLLGNCYDNMGDSKKAVEMYETGIERFPTSGILYLELGVMEMGKKDYNEALSYFEKGIKAEPKFSSNYFWAAQLYCGSTEEVWGMIYGEIFMNIERNSKRTEKISKLLYDTYKSEIKFTSDTSYSVSFSQNATVNINNLSDTSNMKLPFGVGVYEPTLMMSMVEENAIDITSLNTIRKNFVKHYFANKKEIKYPNILFEYQQRILEAGYMDAYNYWILMKGEPAGFAKWQSANKEKWDSFVKWFQENRLVIDGSHKFYSQQY